MVTSHKNVIMQPLFPKRLRFSDTDLLMRALAAGPGGVSMCHLLITGPAEDLDRQLARPESQHLLSWLSCVRSHHKNPAATSSAAINRTPVMINGPLEMLNPENVHATTEPFTYSRVKNSANQHGLLLSWSHTLLDAHAGELVARYLLAYDHNIRIFAAPSNARKISLWRALAASRRYGGIIKNLVSDGFETVTSSHVPACTRSHIQFSVHESEQIKKKLQELSLEGFASSYFIAASAEALALSLLPFPRTLKLIVATPHDARKKGVYRFISPNHLSLVFFKIVAGSNKSVHEQTAEILSQFAAFIRSGAHQAFTDFLAIGRYLPSWIYSKLLYSVNPSGFCSMYVSYLGKGAMVQDSVAQNSRLPTFSLHHFPPHFAKPGISVVFWWSGQCLNVSLVLGDETLNLAQRERFESTLRRLVLHAW